LRACFQHETAPFVLSPSDPPVLCLASAVLVVGAQAFCQTMDPVGSKEPDRRTERPVWASTSTPHLDAQYMYCHPSHALMAHFTYSLAPHRSHLLALGRFLFARLSSELQPSKQVLDNGGKRGVLPSLSMSRRTGAINDCYCSSQLSPESAHDLSVYVHRQMVNLTSRLARWGNERATSLALLRQCQPTMSRLHSGSPSAGLIHRELPHK